MALLNIFNDPTAPASRVESFVPAAGAGETLPFTARAIRVGVAGDLIARAIGSSSDVTIAALEGEMIVGYFSHIRDASTADGLVIFGD